MLYKELTEKQIRIINRDLKLIFSIKGVLLPKNIENIIKLGVFSPRVKLKERELYLSKEGITALERICEIISNLNKYKGLLNYNDIYQSVLLELGKWFEIILIPDVYDFFVSLDTALSKNIQTSNLICRIDGISLDGLNKINIGGKTIKIYDKSDLNGASDVHKNIKSHINREYHESLIIMGSEHGSNSVAMEKFYFNAELSLSIIRLYSCALYKQSIHKVNIRLINNCTHSYGSASCIRQDEYSHDITFTSYGKSTQDFKIDNELLTNLNKEMFFETISSLVSKDYRNDLENAIIKSLYWIGESQKDQSNPSAFVKLWSALECFFTLEKGDITERNARGIASIIMYGDFHHIDFKDYSQLKNKIKKHYKSRSKIVHHAEFSQIDNIQLEEMAFIACWVTIAMAALLTRGYTKLSDIEREAQRLDAMHHN
ncbi:HEPN domain-containing protein [Aeromonas veronii]|uniref:HEPN domain-containing protein n=1 Tax=Aeromonas veronii TaxID=654 RepID=UPI001F0A36D9|nr:HEPN domain-containing protein [Aeromonas veronii]